jgi:hypothetical protein
MAVFEALIEEIRKVYKFTISVKCAVHTLQLAVRKAIKTANSTVLITMCRAVAKELRKQKYIYYLRQQNVGFILPRLDCLTRWSSTYILVKKNNLN